MKKIGFSLCLFLVISISTSVLARPVINYEGSSTVGKFMKDAQKVYKKASINSSILTESNGGEICPLAKTCDIGGVARNIHALFISRGLYAIPFAYDILTAIVNSENPVKSLTSEQIGDIFSGKIKNWNEVGGENLPIKTYIVGRESATRDVFKKHILKDREYRLDSEVVRPDSRVVLMVTLDRGGIGHISYSFAATNDQVRPLLINGQNSTVNNPNYPVRRLLHLTTFGPPQGHIKDFIEWALSKEGQKIVKKRFLPLETE